MEKVKHNNRKAEKRYFLHIAGRTLSQCYLTSFATLALPRKIPTFTKKMCFANL